MWTCVTIIFLVPAVVVTMQLLSPRQEYSPTATEAEFSGIAAQSLNESGLEVV
jgi:hypothetical protein